MNMGTNPDQLSVLKWISQISLYRRSHVPLVPHIQKVPSLACGFLCQDLGSRGVTVSLQHQSQTPTPGTQFSSFHNTLCHNLPFDVLFDVIFEGETKCWIFQNIQWEYLVNLIALPKAYNQDYEHYQQNMFNLIVVNKFKSLFNNGVVSL